MLSRHNLHKYQERAVDFILKQERCMLALEMGLGKSVSTLTAISDMLDGFTANKVLVIAPLRVANSVWAQETRLWEHLRHLRVSVATGSNKARREALSLDADIYVINRENVPWLVENYGRRWDFDVVVIDESSSFKNSQSKRFKALRKMLPNIDSVILLTGTPSPNGLLDLWAQMYLVDYGERLGRTLTNYKQRFFEADYWGRKFEPRKGSEEQIHALLTDKIIHMSAEDYLDMPDRIDLSVRVALPSKVAEGYQDFERTMLAELDDGEEVEAATAAVLANKLMQYANGALYTDPNGNWSETHAAKLDALSEIVEDNEGETILVAYNYKSDLARLLKRFPQAKLLDKRQETIDAWNRGDIPMLLAHPASAGHGLNLQKGGALCVWFGLNWSLELYQQFNARLHRQGQTRPVRVVHILAENTIDERVMGVLGNKDATQKNLLNALKP
jgi:SNF2 family DNA or RNA helicase